MRNRLLLPIFLIVCVDILGLTIVIPLLPFYAEKYGASPFIVGLLVTSYAVCQLISGPILGRISDRTGRKPLLLLSQTGTFIGFLILAFANSLPLIFLARIIDGVTAGNLSLAQAYISDVTAPEDRAKSFGIIGIAFGLGFLVGPAVSGMLATFGYHYPIFAAAGLSLTSIMATYFLLPKRTMEPESGVGNDQDWWRVFHIQQYVKYFHDKRLADLLTQFFFFAFSFSLFVSGFALFSERRFLFGPKEVGFVFAYSGFLGLIIQGGLLGRLVKRFGELNLAVSGFLFAGIGYTLLGFSFGMTTLLLAASVSSFGNGFLRPCLSSLISRHANRNEQGVVMGITQSLNSISQIIAPLFAGLLIEFEWLTPWALATAVITLFGFLLGLRRKKVYGN